MSDGIGVLRRGRRGVALLGLLLAVLLIGFFYGRTQQFLVVGDQSGHTRLVLRVNRGERVTLAYIHSALKAPVEEIFTVDGSVLTIRETIFQAYGFGMPTESSQRFFVQDGKFYITDINEFWPEIPLRVHSIPNQTLQIRGLSYNLVDLVGSGNLVRLRAMTGWQLVFQRVRDLI